MFLRTLTLRKPKLLMRSRYCQPGAPQLQQSQLEKYIAELSDEHLMKTAKIEQELKNSQARVLQLSLKLAGYN